MKVITAVLALMLTATFFSCGTTVPETPPTAEDSLRMTIDSIARDYNAKIGVAIYGLDSAEQISLNGTEHFTIMSVVKFPQALAILRLVDEHRLDMDSVLHFTKEEMQRQTFSKMKERYGSEPLDLTLRETIAYAVGTSDNVACDKLFTLFSPQEVEGYFHGRQFMDIGIGTNYTDMTDATMNKNWCTPECMANILTDFAQGRMLNDTSTQFLLHVMTESGNPDNRIKGQLPATAVVAHKTGTASQDSTGYRAFNDVGIVQLPGGKRFAIAVFINDSKEDEARNAEAIARISLAAWSYFETH
jgi:beta-lactamase class A